MKTTKVKLDGKYIIFPRNRNLVGIIPANCNSLSFGMPWSNYLTPIADNYMAIENAVVEAVWSGARSVWIVVNRNLSPFVKYRLGDYIYDPMYESTLNTKRPRRIPIFYLPIHELDYERRDTSLWAIVYAAHVIYKVYSEMSRIIVPSKFLIKWPFGIYPTDICRDIRKYIRLNNEQAFYLTYKGKTYKDGLNLSFSLDMEQCVRYRRIIKKMNKKEAMKVDFSSYFIDALSYKKPQKLEVPWYYSIDSWEGYRDFLSSEHSKTIKRPLRRVLGSAKKKRPINLSYLEEWEENKEERVREYGKNFIGYPKKKEKK